MNLCLSSSIQTFPIDRPTAPMGPIIYVAVASSLLPPNVPSTSANYFFMTTPPLFPPSPSSRSPHLPDLDVNNDLIFCSNIILAACNVYQVSVMHMTLDVSTSSWWTDHSTNLLLSSLSEAEESIFGRLGAPKFFGERRFTAYGRWGNDSYS